ncbi:uncharacterized protein JCM6883_002510 [Sporobolomyces salmoneus]|uniref:uncharacterized protein n=1 Tax=Sporobolomyces salmoneus TaxID=183962 RepID=UPI00316F6533
MTTFSGLHTLPPELVSHILTLSVPPVDPLDPLSRVSRSRTLTSIALVCSSWRIVAQRLLLDDGRVAIYHSKELQPLLDVVLGVGSGLEGISKLLRSLELTLWGEDEERLTKLVGMCEGLEELSVEHVDRLRFDQVVTPNLRSFSARQCTFISSEPFTYSSPYPSLALYPNLKSLDLRFNSFRLNSLPLQLASFPTLQNLLCFVGSQDQSSKSIQAFLKMIKGQLKAISVDHQAWNLLFSPSNSSFDSGETDSEVPPDPPHLSLSNLRILGLYWDAAALDLVGSELLLPPPSPSSSPYPSSTPSSLSKSTSTSTSKWSKFTPPPYLHLSLYPIAIPSLLATMTSLLEGNKDNAATRWGWKKIHHFRFEQTFKQLSLDEVEEEDDQDVLASDSDDVEEGDAADGEGRGGRTTNEVLLKKFMELPRKAGVENVTVDESEERGTKERGFRTSWWRFVRDVEMGNV